MKDLEVFVKKKLKSELIEVKLRNKPQTLLTIFEETIIYKYTDDGYEDLNENLRLSNGKSNSEFGELLSNTLSKLPNYKGLIFRGANLTSTELKRYKDHLTSGKPIIEHAFISASKSRLVAMQFGAKCLFRMWSKTAKSVEEYAKFGIGNSQNEREVMFLSNGKFKVIEITNENGVTLITLEEI